MSNQFKGLYLNVINTLTNPLFIKDSEHKFIFLNDACCTFLDLDRDELLGKSDYDFFPKEQSDEFWKKDNEVLESGKPNTNEEELTNSNGEKFTILTSKSRIPDEAGNNYILGIITDITEMKFDEIQLEKKNIQIKAQKNQIESLIRQVHHHSKENLSIINQQIESILDQITEKHSAELLEDLGGWIKSMMNLHQYFQNTVNLASINIQEYLVQLSDEILKEQGSKIELKINSEPLHLEMRTMFPLGLIFNELLHTCLKQCQRNDNKMNLTIDLSNDRSSLNIVFSSDKNFLQEQKDVKVGRTEMIQTILGEIAGTFKKESDSKLFIQFDDVKLIDKSIY